MYTYRLFYDDLTWGYRDKTSGLWTARALECPECKGELPTLLDGQTTQCKCGTVIKREQEDLIIFPVGEEAICA